MASVGPYCSECGCEWGGYAPGEQQHYCRGNVRKFRREPTHDERQRHAAEMRDPYKNRQYEQEHWRKRYRQ